MASRPTYPLFGRHSVAPAVAFLGACACSLCEAEDSSYLGRLSHCGEIQRVWRKYKRQYTPVGGVVSTPLTEAKRLVPKTHEAFLLSIDDTTAAATRKGSKWPHCSTAGDVAATPH